MKREDFQRAFGSADERFASAVTSTLQRLRAEEEPAMKKKLSVTLAVAIVACLLLAATALAAVSRAGILERLTGFFDVEVLPEASQLITQPTQAGGELDVAEFTLREAIYDGEYVYLLVDVQPAQGILLLGPDTLPKDLFACLRPGQSVSDMTIADYARENDLRMFQTSIGSTDQSDIDLESLGYYLNDDGSLSYDITATVTQKGTQALEIDLRCTVLPIAAAQNPEEESMAMGRLDEGAAITPLSDFMLVTDELQTVNLTATLEKSGQEHTRSCETPAVYDGCGVRVDKVTLTGTPMALYYQIDFTVVDQDAYAATEDGVWFEFIGEDGDASASGATLSGMVMPLGDGRLRQSGSLSAMSELPASIELRAYDCWEKTRFETHTFDLHS